MGQCTVIDPPLRTLTCRYADDVQYWLLAPSAFEAMTHVSHGPPYWQVKVATESVSLVEHVAREQLDTLHEYDVGEFDAVAVQSVVPGDCMIVGEQEIPDTTGGLPPPCAIVASDMLPVAPLPWSV